ncbi:unnamed protein product [Cladocopium goreaui]|uniref:Uncharacterized protein n=1 Tax=Cladocopium goreaui TaxID=2562237 RepID=A0A9P1D0D2_9DINO|nr:unnamed protein product [Cladocopium goreaui]
MSSTLDTDVREKSRWEQPADVRQAALNFSTALQSAPARQFPALWTLPQEKPEAGFGVKAERLVQEQAGFVRKVEQELKRFGQTLDQHSCFQQDSPGRDHGKSGIGYTKSLKAVGGTIKPSKNSQHEKVQHPKISQLIFVWLWSRP